MNQQINNYAIEAEVLNFLDLLRTTVGINTLQCLVMTSRLGFTCQRLKNGIHWSFVWSLAMWKIHLSYMISSVVIEIFPTTDKSLQLKSAQNSLIFHFKESLLGSFMPHWKYITKGAEWAACTTFFLCLHLTLWSRKELCSHRISLCSDSLWNTEHCWQGAFLQASNQARAIAAKCNCHELTIVSQRYTDRAVKQCAQKSKLNLCLILA